MKNKSYGQKKKNQSYHIKGINKLT